ncbi:hypothetical protein EJ05DRAFT_99426 [Pseudovirgaria hyperparasitica]|uniref:Uncharacterized protein n=1 Tax=Pseudovirgaria hyperparasitica TaxID=470096 RepID=A0A6A6VYR3_9PEZI|nr:uncharacterized protein EJ05DRAFT_99426 [Pseudovirgaria hyperparasitica]KAF2755365.1 hypothetical protein EJ05DRAFT_99426 [Pseudovirgaria hyperparasitica]
MCRSPPALATTINCDDHYDSVFQRLAISRHFAYLLIISTINRPWIGEGAEYKQAIAVGAHSFLPDNQHRSRCTQHKQEESLKWVNLNSKPCQLPNLNYLPIIQISFLQIRVWLFPANHLLPAIPLHPFQDPRVVEQAAAARCTRLSQQQTPPTRQRKCAHMLSVIPHRARKLCCKSYTQSSPLLNNAFVLVHDSRRRGNKRGIV